MNQKQKHSHLVLLLYITKHNSTIDLIWRYHVVQRNYIDIDMDIDYI